MKINIATKAFKILMTLFVKKVFAMEGVLPVFEEIMPMLYFLIEAIKG